VTRGFNAYVNIKAFCVLSDTGLDNFIIRYWTIKRISSRSYISLSLCIPVIPILSAIERETEIQIVRLFQC